MLKQLATVKCSKRKGSSALIEFVRISRPELEKMQNEVYLNLLCLPF
jgi:hypothetical protein